MRGRPKFDAYYQLLADETEKRVQAMIDVDRADVRKYSKESSFTRLEALLEMIDAKWAA